MGLASYAIVEHRGAWVILHDGEAEGDFETKEAAFESAMSAAALAVRQGHEVHVTAPGREASTIRGSH
jgi:phosphotransferase system HPr-like phosphotransfer protein